MQPQIPRSNSGSEHFHLIPDSSNFLHKTACEQVDALRSGEISAIELLEQTIVHAEKLSPLINPIALTLYDRAREAAIRADKLLKRGKGGPLCGLPITVKDSQWLAGYPCANGSLSLKDFVPDQTCAAITRLENAGAVLFAKTTCPEFCVSGTNNSPLYGATLNPWNLSKTPGGSSGGAAASVAAGIGSLSLGGDGGGSIRIPAAFCGIVGFKPSHGRVQKSPGFPTWESLVSYGPMSRSVSDAKLMFDVLADPPSEVHEQNIFSASQSRIVVSEDLGFAPVDSDVRDVFRAAVEKISGGGITTVYDSPGLGTSVVTWATVATADMWKYKSGSLSPDNAESSLLGVYAKEFIKFGARFNTQDIEDARANRTEIFEAYQALFKRNRARILITPTLGREAFHHTLPFPQIIEETPITYPWLDWAGFLYDANLVGMPACTIPMGLGDQNLPLGLQVMGLPGDDEFVLQVSAAIESLLGWAHSPEPFADRSGQRE
ncbi:MAG: amidase [Pseudomonadota bacterium]